MSHCDHEEAEEDEQRMKKSATLEYQMSEFAYNLLRFQSIVLCRYIVEDTGVAQEWEETRNDIPYTHFFLQIRVSKFAQRILVN